ncbi:MAG: hypothetical protein OXI56_05605 [bacterium]|nr:hypothetical protein [bacterium]
MDLAEAVKKAKATVGEVFAGEGVGELRLEEVVFATYGDGWKVTVSFLRPLSSGGDAIAVAFGGRTRYHKVVEMDSRGEVLSVKNRDNPSG